MGMNEGSVAAGGAMVPKHLDENVAPPAPTHTDPPLPEVEPGEAPTHHDPDPIELPED